MQSYLLRGSIIRFHYTLAQERQYSFLRTALPLVVQRDSQNSLKLLRKKLSAFSCYLKSRKEHELYDLKIQIQPKTEGHLWQALL